VEKLKTYHLRDNSDEGIGIVANEQTMVVAEPVIPTVENLETNNLNIIDVDYEDTDHQNPRRRNDEEIDDAARVEGIPDS